MGKTKKSRRGPGGKQWRFHDGKWTRERVKEKRKEAHPQPLTSSEDLAPLSTFFRNLTEKDSNVDRLPDSGIPPRLHSGKSDGIHHPQVDTYENMVEGNIPGSYSHGPPQNE